MNRLLVLRAAIVGALVFTQGCTEPGETTGVAAASGGVLGAGLGAIVGNQTGDPSTGLVIGALAGAGAGAAIGNALEAQEQSIRTQDEALERQEKMMRAQNAEIAELRQIRGDTAAYSAGQRRVYNPPLRPAQKGTAEISEREITGVSSGSFESRSIQVDESARGSLTTATLSSNSASASKGYGAIKKSPSSPECDSAKGELAQAERAQDNAKKLFHVRRALRLCPDDATGHNALGELYMNLGRSTDAEYEFKEALRLDPSYQPAQDNLNAANLKSNSVEVDSESETLRY